MPVLQLLTRKPRRRPKKGSAAAASQAAVFEPAARTTLESDPVNQCLQLERYAWLIAHRNEWAEHAGLEKACAKARAQIDDLFAIVPEGFATMPESLSDEAGGPETTVDTDAFLLSRYPVTNAQYQNFVDAGAYEDLDLWPEQIWPHLIDFKDQTEQAAPRYWRECRHDRPLAEHPVVGVSIYEATAYAKWAGYRLPTESEWQMAATWRIRSEANVMRRYPWGDAFDTQRCNVWASRVGRTAQVDAYPDGAAPNGVLQLIGNVWEWTSSDLNLVNDEGGVIVGDMRMSAVRGGAFDTYFHAQATSIFRTGLMNMARAGNVGFRCGLSLAESNESASAGGA